MAQGLVDALRRRDAAAGPTGGIAREPTDGDFARLLERAASGGLVTGDVSAGGESADHRGADRRGASAGAWGRGARGFEAAGAGGDGGSAQAASRPLAGGLERVLLLAAGCWIAMALIVAVAGVATELLSPFVFAAILTLVARNIVARARKSSRRA